MPTDDNTLETLVHKEGDLVKFNGAEFLWHDEWYGPESPHGLPFLDIAKSIDTKFDVGDVEFDYKKLTNGQDEKLNPIYPHLYNGAKNLANMCLGCGHTGVAQALADTIYDFQLPGWLVEINTGIGCGGKLSSQFKAVLSETDEEAREKISDDLLAKIAEEVGTINVTLEKDGRQEDLIPLEKLGLSYLEGLFNANRSHVTHGYSPSKTIGNLIAQPGLVRVIAGGDGDMGAIGLQDFKRAIQYNINALIIPMVNEVFGLTKGQASFSAPNGWQAKRMKSMHKTEPIDFVMEALGMSDSTYVARIISGNRKEMNNHFKAGILHDGTAVVDVASPCVTWNREHGTKFYKDISIDIKMPKVSSTYPFYIYRSDDIN